MSDRNPFDLDQVEQEIGRREDEWLDIVSNLIQIPSVNPPGDTTEICEYVTNLLDEQGIPYEIIDPKSHMPNIAAQFDGGVGDPTDGPHLGLNGHLDTFPIGDEEKWDRDPFSGAVENGKIHGLGACDMHGGFTASLASFLYLFENRDRFCGRVTFTATSDEETGSKWGADYLLENHPEYRSDVLINGEPSATDIIRFGGRGAVWLNLEVDGESDHSAYPGGLNAIDELVNIVEEIREEIDSFVEISDQKRNKIRNAEEKFDPIFGEGATDTVLGAQVNLNKIDGGEKVNLTASQARAELDVRMPIATDGKEVIKRIREIADQSPADTTVDVFHHTDPTNSDSDNLIFECLQRNAERVRGGDAPKLTCGLAMTDGRFFRQYNIPTAHYGPTPYNIGHPNEYITVDDFMVVTKAQAMASAEYMNSLQ